MRSGGKTMIKGSISTIAILAGLGIGGAVQAETIYSVTQVKYDPVGRVQCTAVRMNTAVYGSLPSDACALGTPGTDGPDRITKNTYDNAGQLLQVDQAYGVTTANGFPQTLQRAYARYTYTNNGIKYTEKDANGNLTTFDPDGFDRLKKLSYPSTTLGAGTSSGTDYETFAYDLNGNKTSWRRRNGSTITYCFDSVNRTLRENVSGVSCVTAGQASDVFTDYDGLGHIISKRFGSTSGSGVAYAYDGLGRVTSTTDWNGRTIAYQYNLAGARTRLTYPDGNYIDTTTLDNLNRIKTAKWNGSSSVYGLVFNSLGQRKKLQLSTGAAPGDYNDSACATSTKAVCYGYDAIGLLASYSLDPNGTGADVAWTFTNRNPAGQITKWGINNSVYDYKEKTTVTGCPNSIVCPTYDGLNRDAGLAAISGGYDANGNLAKEGNTSDKRVMTYDLMNRLLTVAPGNAPTTPYLTLQYDPEGRLAKYTTSTGTTEFLYDGANLIAEYSSTGMTQRYVFGPGTDEPLVWYQGSQITTPYFFMTNYQGSIVGYMSSGGSVFTWYKYGPYGEPKDSADSESWGGPRFRYTGQYALPEAKLYYYKARVYDPGYGRFLQTDPIGSKDDFNLYAYVAGDPINRVDPTGNGGIICGICLIKAVVSYVANSAPGVTVTTTGGVKGSAAAGPVGAHGSVEAGVATDDTGDTRAVATATVGANAGAEAGAGPVGSITVANGRVEDQDGVSVGGGVDVGPVSVTAQTSQNKKQQNVTSVTVSVSPQAGASGHADVSNTVVSPVPLKDNSGSASNTQPAEDKGYHCKYGNCA